MESGLWQDIVSYKYLRKDSVTTVKHKQSDTPIWANLIQIRDIYLQGRKKCVKNGKTTLVWKDSWLYNAPLCTLHPDLFKLCNQKDITVFQLISGEVNISFSRWLTPDLQSEWCTIKDEIFAIQLGSDQDTVS
jgi:hypothetical protein